LPETPAGTVTFSSVELTYWTDASLPPTVTVESMLKPVPVTSRMSPTCALRGCTPSTFTLPSGTSTGRRVETSSLSGT
jgi:hypothetical protein